MLAEHTDAVNRLSVLNEAPHFDVCKCMPHDIMHVILEGVLPLHTKLLLVHCIYEERLFTLKTANKLIIQFEYGSVAVVSRVKTLHLDDKTPIGDLSKVPVSAFLPSITDCAALRDNFVILVARILVDNLASFSFLRKCVPIHIQHEYTSFMKEKTVSVSLGVTVN